MNEDMSRRRYRQILALGAIAMVAFVGCGGGERLESGAADGAVRSTFAPADDCSEDDGVHRNFVSMSGYLTSQTDWHQLDSMSELGVADGRVVRITSTEMGENQRPSERDVRVSRDLLAPLRSAIDNKVPTYYTARDNGEQLILGAVIVAPEGEPAFFAGYCTTRALYEPLAAIHGDKVDSVVRELPFMSQSELEIAVGLDSRPGTDSTEPEIVVLNPEDVSEEVLNGLQFASVAVRLDPSTLKNEGKTVCFRTTAGWNDCLLLDAATLASGVDVDVYVEADGYIEAWLTDENADLRNPIVKIGDIYLDERLRGPAPVALSIELRGDLGSQDSTNLQVLAQGLEDEISDDAAVWGVHAKIESPAR